MITFEYFCFEVEKWEWEFKNIPPTEFYIFKEKFIEPKYENKQ